MIKTTDVMQSQYDLEFSREKNEWKILLRFSFIFFGKCIVRER